MVSVWDGLTVNNQITRQIFDAGTGGADPWPYVARRSCVYTPYQLQTQSQARCASDVWSNMNRQGRRSAVARSTSRGSRHGLHALFR